jgi:L-amino acid N-acyltransferase YncA
MASLHIEQPNDDSGLQDWQHVHNTIVPSAAMSLDEVRDRAHRYRLEVAYREDELIGCTTVRPPEDDPSAATLIVRVLPVQRRQGYGEQLYARGMTQAQALGATAIETIVLASNLDGLRFAEAHGFVEVSRYLPPDDTVPFITLRSSPAATPPPRS